MSITLTLPLSCDFGELVYPPGGTFGPRLQRTCQVFVVYHGDALVLLDERVEIAVGPGYGLLLLPGRLEWFRFATATQTALAWCHIQYEPADLPKDLPLALSQHPFVADRTLTDLLDAGNHLQQPGTGITERTLGSAILSLLRDGARPKAARHLPAPLQRALAFIERHYEEDLVAADIADASGTSGPNLRRLFRSQLQRSPMDALWGQRLGVATTLLKSSGLSIAEIAYRCGFKSPYHFSRRFGAATGASPRAFRNRIWHDGKG